MRIRPMRLSSGWYPRGHRELRDLIGAWTRELPPPLAGACLAPHAGFAFSGRLAARAWASLAGAETYVVIGGHLPPGAPVLIAPEEGFEGPFGTLAADVELRETLVAALGDSALPWEEDEGADNSVEIQLPFLGFLAPGARLLWLRAPAGPASIDLGRALRAAASSLGRGLALVASTDLTHYGPDYGFEPRGRGPEAERWVREVNDRRFLDALIAGDPRSLLERALREGSACSPGAAAAALSYFLAEGEEPKVELLDYDTGLAVRRAPSFVGYASLSAVSRSLCI